MAIDGTYEVQGKAKGIDLAGTIDVATDGDQLTGVAHIMDSDIPLENGHVSGNDFTCEVSAATPMGNLRFKVAGSVDGDTISGTLKHLLIKAPFRGTRI